MTVKNLREQLESGLLDARLKEIYLTEDPAAERARVEKVLDMYESWFGTGSGSRQTVEPESPETQDSGKEKDAAGSASVSGRLALYSAPGRTELGGNHTDHQRGCVLAASVSLDLMAAAAPNGTSTVVLKSEGYDVLRIDIADETVHPEEVNQTASLIRGIAAAIRQRGYQPQGFNACVISDVPGGSGLSSSAAFETLIGVIFNHMFCADSLNPVEIAKIGQYAENVYFGKPCGLMDQMACSVGGAIAIDFEHKEEPVITKIPFSFENSGYQLCIIDSGADHADLTEDYAAVPAEMKSVAGYFGKEVLREVPEHQFREAIASLRKACGDRAVLRASHFYKENDRVFENSRGVGTIFVHVSAECLQQQVPGAAGGRSRTDGGRASARRKRNVPRAWRRLRRNNPGICSGRGCRGIPQGHGLCTRGRKLQDFADPSIWRNRDCINTAKKQ